MFAAVFVFAAEAFAAPSLAARSSLVRSSLVAASRCVAPAIQMSMGIFEGVREPVEAYVGIWTPMFKTAVDAGVPDFIVHWGHGAAMATVLFTMALYGTFLGWQVTRKSGSLSVCV
ncbi:hypothetical protein T492DRAFT_865972 [Pavlovales sp. CCMP2436]|nr:hypothetical protein T492DRAFT_865972 [Pavlovales sp. CCMP2436]